MIIIGSVLRRTNGVLPIYFDEKARDFADCPVWIISMRRCKLEVHAEAAGDESGICYEATFYA